MLHLSFPVHPFRRPFPVAFLLLGSELTHTHFFGPNAPKPFPVTEEVVRLHVE